MTKIETEGKLPSLAGAIAWLNSEPLDADALRGKVVLINFWTYTCINWLRTLPYTRAWAEKYRDDGLVVIGVHTPEFSFEHDIDNVREAMKDMGIVYPVAVDNDYAIWRALRNHYWPALYFVDASGRIRHHQFGEGQYEEAEGVIKQLLAEAGAGRIDSRYVMPDATGAEQAADWENLRSAENYLGYQRAENFASPDGIEPGQQHDYVAPEHLRLNQWSLAGRWTIGNEAVVLKQPKGRIIYRFHARDLNLVAGPTKKGTAVPFRVLLDGRPLRHAHGADVDASGRGTIAGQRLYQLVRQSGPIIDRQFEIEFLEAGVEALVFTFG